MGAGETQVSARLSWSENSDVWDRPALIDANASIFVQVEDLPPGSQLLAIKLRWTPYDLLGPCFWLTAPSEGDSTCQAPVLRTAPTDFLGDSTFWFDLSSAGNGSSACVRFEVWAGACGARVADFCIDGVWVGTTDSLVAAEVVHGATIAGGYGECGVAALQAQPQVFTPRAGAVIELVGGGLGATESVTLEGEGGQVEATDVQVLGPGRIRFEADLSGFHGGVDVAVAGASGSDTLAAALFVTAGTTPAYASNCLIARFQPGVFSLPIGITEGSVGSSNVNDATLLSLLESIGATSISSCFPGHLEDPALWPTLSDPRQLDIWRIDLADTNVLAACAALRADSTRVASAGPNIYYYPDDVVPTDALFPKQWAFRNTGQFGGTPGKDSDGPGAWAITTGYDTVKVAVLDTGGAPTHPDLAGRLVHGSNAAAQDGSNTPLDVTTRGHGIPVAGIIAGKGNGGGQMAGVNWKARVTSIKVSLDQAINPTIPRTALYRGLEQAKLTGQKLINLSLGAVPIPEFPLSRDDEIVHRNLWAAGIFVAASSGNEACAACIRLPAVYAPYVTAVGAMDFKGLQWHDDHIPWADYGYSGQVGGGWPASGSNGTSVLWLVAPGGRMIVTTKDSASYRDVNTATLNLPGSPIPTLIDPNTPWTGFGGTSAAAPMVVGAASLVVSMLGDSIGPEELRTLFATRSDDIGDTGWDVGTGWGSLNLKTLLTGLSPGMRVERGVAGYSRVLSVNAAGSTTYATQPPSTTPNWPSIPAGIYSATEYRVASVATLSESYSHRPLVFARALGSWGARYLPTLIYAPDRAPGSNWLANPRFEAGCDTLISYPDSLILETRVYRLSSPTLGDYWWPCDPASVKCAWTAVGVPASLVSVPQADSQDDGWSLEGVVRARGKRALSLSVQAGEAREGVVELLDVAGRRVAVGHTVRFTRGHQVVETPWPGGTPAGLYFVRVRAGSWVGRAKLVWQE